MAFNTTRNSARLSWRFLLSGLLVLQCPSLANTAAVIDFQSVPSAFSDGSGAKQNLTAGVTRAVKDPEDRMLGGVQQVLEASPMLEQLKMVYKNFLFLRVEKSEEQLYAKLKKIVKDDNSALHGPAEADEANIQHIYDEMLQHWVNEGTSPARIIELLELDTEESSFWGSPSLATWNNFVAKRNKNENSYDLLIKGMKQRYRDLAANDVDEKLARILRSAVENKVDVDRYKPFQIALFHFWAKENKRPKDVFKLLRINKGLVLKLNPNFVRGEPDSKAYILQAIDYSYIYMDMDPKRSYIYRYYSSLHDQVETICDHELTIIHIVNYLRTRYRDVDVRQHLSEIAGHPSKGDISQQLYAEYLYQLMDEKKETVEQIVGLLDFEKPDFWTNPWAIDVWKAFFNKFDQTNKQPNEMLIETLQKRFARLDSSTADEKMVGILKRAVEDNRIAFNVYESFQLNLFKSWREQRKNSFKLFDFVKREAKSTNEKLVYLKMWFSYNLSTTKLNNNGLHKALNLFAKCTSPEQLKEELTKAWKYNKGEFAKYLKKELYKDYSRTMADINVRKEREFSDTKRRKIIPE